MNSPNVQVKFPIESKLPIVLSIQIELRPHGKVNHKNISCEESTSISVIRQCWHLCIVWNILLWTTKLPELIFDWKIDKQTWKPCAIVWHHIITNALLRCRSENDYLLLMSPITAELPFKMNRFSCSARTFQLFQRNCCTTLRTIIMAHCFNVAEPAYPVFPCTRIFFFSPLARIHEWNAKRILGKRMPGERNESHMLWHRIYGMIFHSWFSPVRIKSRVNWRWILWMPFL